MSRKVINLSVEVETDNFSIYEYDQTAIAINVIEDAKACLQELYGTRGVIDVQGNAKDGGIGQASKEAVLVELAEFTKELWGTDGDLLNPEGIVRDLRHILVRAGYLPQ